MYQLPYPSREFVGDHELERIERANEELVESTYQDAVAIFRADVVTEMACYGASYAEHAWLLYQNEMAEDSEGDVMVRNEELRQILVMMHRFNMPAYRSSPITVRILSLFKHRIDDDIAFVSEDVIVDMDGDAQLCVDVIFGKNPPPIYPEYAEPSNSPLFLVHKESGLNLHNFNPFPPIVTVDLLSQPDNERPQVIPYGHFQIPSDREYALQRARDLFVEAKSLDVVANSLPIVDN